MKPLRNSIKLLALASVAMAFAGYAVAQEKVQIAGAACETPPPQHCPDKDCTGDRMVAQGGVVEMKTRRTYYLDYPCDLKAGEKVTFVLSLHGGGSYGNWQRNYFPIMDYKDQYRLVIATPNSPTHVWSEADDEYLHNIVNFVSEQLAKNKVATKAFWLVGHSQGGMTSNRIVRSDFFKDKVTGFLSLSGGRIGGSPTIAPDFGPARARPAAPQPAAAAAGTPPTAAGPGGPSASVFAALAVPPANEFSFIYATGQHEMDAKGLPATSTLADKLGCGKRVSRADVVDTKAGYVYDGTSQNPSRASWGGLPLPGKAQVFEYPGCKGGRIVADVVRLDKGHTEGLEPKVTEEMVKLMMSAKN